MLSSVFYLSLFLSVGLLSARRAVPDGSAAVIVPLGCGFGVSLLAVLPALFAVVLGFTLPAVALAAAAAAGIGAALLYRGTRLRGMAKDPDSGALWACLLPVVLITLYLLHTHVLHLVDGAYHTGQSCYGDMPMHLGFIKYIAQSGEFLPRYPLLGGTHRFGYPFLCETVSSVFVVLGADLRTAYLLPMLPAFLSVYGMFWQLARRVTDSAGKACLAFYLFFMGSGLGFAYFLGSADSFAGIFTGFYTTPTNFVEKNIEWVNPIVDLLIPQRATLFGWCVLLPAVYLLWRFCYDGERRLWPWLTALVLPLPLLHTHSALALVLLCLVGGVYTLAQGPRRKTLLPWLELAAVCGAAWLCQMLPTVLAQSLDGQHMLRLHFNWINGQDDGTLKDNYFWFYIKNIGLVYLLLIPAFLRAKPKQRWLYGGGLAILALAEFVVFQPNNYDNNKLLYVVHMLSCGVVASFLATLWHKLHGLPGRAALGTLILAPGLLAGTLTLIRETVSDYQLFSAPEVAAARFAGENLPVDAILLTADEHNNPFACLSGFTIVQGSPSFLYFHGIYDTDRAADVTAMYTQEGALEELAGKYGITHVVLSEYEYNLGADAALFEDLPVVFSSHGVTIYSLK